MDNTFKERAAGAVGEIIMVVDSSMWNGAVGAELKETFRASFPGLYRDEPLFSVRQVNPEKLTKTLRNARNVIYVTTLDDNSDGGRIIRSNYTPETLSKIKEDPNLFMSAIKDEFAYGQETIHLFGRSKAELIANIERNRDRLRDHFSKTERNHISQKLTMSRETSGMQKSMEEKFGLSIQIPAGFRLVNITDDFIWLRMPTDKLDKNIFMYLKSYDSENDFNHESILEWRDQIGRLYIYGDPENAESFMMTERRIEIAQRNINFGKKYGVETRGQWRTNNKSMGGSFISYVFTDEASKRIIYLEGFIYHPNEKHRDVLREIEAILWTIQEKTVAQAKA
jgi:hypothetical protein